MKMYSPTHVNNNISHSKIITLDIDSFVIYVGHWSVIKGKKGKRIFVDI